MMTEDWLTHHRGETVVVKFGGNAMVDDALADAFAQDILALHTSGVRVVVTHGGGPQISAELAARGIASEFRGGLRYTSPEAVLAVRDVLLTIGAQLATRMSNAGVSATSIAGHTGSLFTATRRGTVVDGLPVDLGRVGEVTSVDPTSILDALNAGQVPVVSSIAPDGDDLLNVNADSAAASLAIALTADWLILLTDVAGLYRDWPNQDSLITAIDADQLGQLLPELQSGMIPKMGACLSAVTNGVGAAAIVDGRESHSLTRAPFGEGGTTVRLKAKEGASS